MSETVFIKAVVRHFFNQLSKSYTFSNKLLATDDIVFVETSLSHITETLWQEIDVPEQTKYFNITFKSHPDCIIFIFIFST